LRFGKAIIAVFIGVLIFFITALFAVYNDIKERTIDDLNKNQMVHALQAARGIQDHIGNIISTLEFFAHLTEVIDVNDEGKRIMKDYQSLHADEVKGVTRVDARGRIVYTAPYKAEAIGRDISAQEHISEILLTHETVISDVFTAVQGFRTIAIHVPVFKNKAFDGTIAFLLSFDTLAQRHIENIRIGKSGYAWVISEKGIEISCPVPGHVGRSVYDTCKDFPDIIAMAKEMMKGHKGITTYHFDRIRGTTGEKFIKHAVYMPIPIGNTFWSIVIATPDDEVLTSMAGFKTKFTLIIAGLLIFTMAFTYIQVKSQVMITEQKKRKTIMEALQESEKKYRTLIETTGTGFVIVDHEGIVLDANPEYVHLTGYQGLSQILGRSVIEWTAPYEKKKNEEAVRQCFGQGYIRNFEIDYRDQEGNITPIEINATVVELGGTPRILTLCRDISERRKAEVTLHRNEDMLQRSQKIAHLGSYALDAQKGTWTSAPTLDEIFGIHQDYPKDMQGWIALVHPDQREEMLHYLKGHVLEGHNRFEKEYRIVRHSDHQERWVSEVGELEFDEQGNTTRMIGTIQDITERKHSDEALRQSESKYRLLTEKMEDIVWTTDLNLKVTYTSPSTEKIMGFTIEERLHQSIMDRLTPESLAIANDLMKTQLQLELEGGADPHRILRLELEYYRKDGSTVWMENIISAIRDDAGVLIGIHGVSRDITGRKNSEEERERLQMQLMQAQKMESVGRLAGGVAHDFNNILQAILGYTEIALMKVGPSDPLYQTLQEIHKAGKRSADLTRQLLAFARKQVANPKVLDLNDTVSGMLKMLQRLIGEDIDLVLIPGHGLWNIKMDPSQLDQILANLVVNARDAIDGIGRVTIETATVIIDKEYCADHLECVPGEYVILSVEDTGCGMSMETLSNIFEPFFTTKGVGEGTGLGLATVYGIVKQNEGFITIASEPGKGTKFTIHFPRVPDVVRKTPIDTDEKRLLTGTETVLLVEDNEVVLKLGRRILEGLGYNVLSAGTPGEAMKLTGEYPNTIDLLLTDVIMPEINGRELADRLISMRPGLKCLFMSGYTADVIAHHGVLDKGVLFIQKPFSVKSMAEKVREALKKA
jgi:two-component system, cell cycle sensor histidine kinase and response regulator CckA